MSLFVPLAVCAAATDGGRTVASWVWKVSVSGLSRVSVRRHLGAAARLGRLQRAGDGVAEQRVWADFDETWLCSSAAVATAWLNRTGLRRLTTQ